MLSSDAPRSLGRFFDYTAAAAVWRSKGPTTTGPCADPPVASDRSQSPVSQNPRTATGPAPARSPTPPQSRSLAWIARPLSKLSTSRFNLRAGLISDSLISVVLVATATWHGQMRAAAGALTVVL